jgi:predicted RNase H-like HicB family nuclease
MSNYIALIRKDHDSDYGVSFPDLPGCITAGETLDEARDMAEEALALHLDGLVEDGLPVPEPSSLEAIMGDPDNQDGVAILVRAPQKQRIVRVNATFPDDLLQSLDEFAARHGQTRSGLLATIARRELDEASAGDT